MKNAANTNESTFQNSSNLTPAFEFIVDSSTPNTQTKGSDKKSPGTKQMNFEDYANHILRGNQLIKIENTLYIYLNAEGFYAPIFSSNVGFDIRQLLPHDVRGNLNSYSTNEIILWLKILVKEEFDQDAFCDYINFNNCLYNIRNNQYLSHSSSIPFIYKLALSCPTDSSSLPPTPFFDRFLQEVSGGNSGICEMLLDVLAYVICNARLTKNIIILYGPSNTGKSVFLNLLRLAVGCNFTTAIPLEYLGDRFRTVSLMGSRLNIFAELGNQKTANVNILKSLSGGDIINCDVKNSQPVNFKNRAALVFSTNSLEPLRVNDQAFYSRLKIVPFLIQAPKEHQDPLLLNKLVEELPFVVRKYILDSGRLRNYIDNNFIFWSDQFIDPIKYDLFNQEDSIKLFIRTCCRFGDGRIYGDELYGRYLTFCQKKHFQPKTKNQLQRFIESLAKDDFENFPVQRTRFRDNEANKRGFTGMQVLK